MRFERGSSRARVRVFIGIAGALALAAGFSAWGAAGGTARPSQTAEETAEPLTIGRGYEHDAGTVGDRLAAASLQKVGIKATIKVLGSPENAVVALKRGDIELAAPGLNPSLAAMQRGGNFKIVLVTGAGPELVLVAKAARMADLKGKKLGISPWDESKVFAQIVAQRAGLKKSDVKYLAVDESFNRATALIGGRLDAAVLEYVDYLRIKQKYPSVRLLSRAADVLPLTARMLLVNTDRARTNRARLQTVISGLIAGYERLYTDAGRREWIAYAKRTSLKGVPDSLVRQVYDFYRGINMWPRRDSYPTKAAWDESMRFRVSHGLLEAPAPSFVRAFDLSFWKAAKRGG